MQNIKINSALISVYNKDGILDIAEKLVKLNVKIFSTGGTFDYLNSANIPVTAVEEITKYPSIFGGRVKTLHPAIFGGILYRRDNQNDCEELEKFNIPNIDLVIVDLYPFEKTVESRATDSEIIEKIDIGGISLIRAAAKNYKHTVIIPSIDEYQELTELLDNQNGETTLEQRKHFAAKAFCISSHYDTHIFNYLNSDKEIKVYKQSVLQSNTLRYGENPHQNGVFYGDLEKIFNQLHGKALSYNNLVDVDAAYSLISEFTDDPAFVIIKHTNACGAAVRKTMKDAWKCALAGDPVSAFGGVIATNKEIDLKTAEEIDKLFFEVILAPEYNEKAIEKLKSKKNRVILKIKDFAKQEFQSRTLLNGVLEQNVNNYKSDINNFKIVSNEKPTQFQIDDMLFGETIVKHLKSNAIAIVKDNQLLGAGCGMTSRVDAVKHAIGKATENKFDLTNATMSSDAFFPFSDSVSLAFEKGIKCVVQPGGSVRDDETTDFCNEHKMVLVHTGTRHFKH